jgi:hypothetical protein
MPAFALITGKLCSAPETKPAKNGFLVCYYKVRVKSEVWFCSCVAEAAIAELEGLTDGTTISVTGLLHMDLVDYKGTKEIKRSITSSRVLALKPDRGQLGRKQAEASDEDTGELPAWIKPKGILKDGTH